MDAICEFLKITGLIFADWCCFSDRNPFARIRSIIEKQHVGKSRSPKIRIRNERSRIPLSDG